MSLRNAVFAGLALVLVVGCGEGNFGPIAPMIPEGCDEWTVRGGLWASPCGSVESFAAIDYPHGTRALLRAAEWRPGTTLEIVLRVEHIDDLTAVWLSDYPGWQDNTLLWAEFLNDGTTLRFL